MINLVRRVLATAALSSLVGLAAIGVVRSIDPGQPPATPARVATAPDPATGAGAASPADLGGDLPAAIDAILAAEPTAAGRGPATVRGALRRLAAWQRLIHATVVVDGKDGGPMTIQLDHGTISAASATSLTIAESGGGSVTVALGGKTRVRRDGAKATPVGLKTADEVFVMSRVEAGGTTAYLVVVPRR